MTRNIQILLITAAALSASIASAQTGSSTASGTSNTFNPAISLNSLFLARWSDPEDDADGFKAQEMELALTAVVDPYFKAAAYVAYEPDTGSPESETALEEVVVTTTALPAGWGIRAGRFFAPFGRHNQLHTHAFPFVVPPRAVTTILGEESAGDVGIALSYAPILPWYANIHVFAGDGAVEGVFDGESRDLAGGARVESLWDLGEASTLEGGASIWDGPYESDSRRTLAGADIRFKWRDARRTHGHAVEWLAELIWDQPGDADDRIGVYTLGRYRATRRWWFGGGASWTSLVAASGPDRRSEHELRAQAAFIPSEFSALRLDLGWLEPVEGENTFTAQLQLNFTIGSHPAHTY